MEIINGNLSMEILSMEFLSMEILIIMLIKIESHG